MRYELNDKPISALMLMGFPPEKHGSFEDFSIHICREMTRRGYKTHLSFPIEIPKWYMDNILEAGGILAPSILVSKPWVSGSLWKYLQAHNIKILHLHLVNTLVAWFWKLKTGYPLLLTLHVARDYSAGGFSDFAAAFRARLIYRSAKLIAISQYMQNYAQSLGFHIPPQQITCIYNGVDTHRFSPVNNRLRLREKLGWKKEDFIIITVTHLRSEKGVNILLKAFARSLKFQSHFRLAVVGYGPEFETLKKFSRTLDISDKIYWMGKRDDVETILAGADLFVLTPTWDEPFGYVFAEAQSCGIPVISSKSGAIPEIIQDGKTGIIVEKNDEYALSEAIVKISGNTSKMIQMAQRSRINVLHRFDIRNQVKATVDLYEKEYSVYN